MSVKNFASGKGQTVTIVTAVLAAKGNHVSFNVVIGVIRLRTISAQSIVYERHGVLQDKWLISLKTHGN